MAKENVRDLVYKLAEPVVEENGMELVDVEYVKEGAGWYLRLYIDKESGVDLDDCQKISTIISGILDTEDPIEQAYFLEVSSPGIDRPLKNEKDFQKYLGHNVIVHTYSPFERKKNHHGKLGPYSRHKVVLIVEKNKELEIPKNIVSQVRLDIGIKEGE